MSDLSTMTPVEVDTALAAAHTEHSRAASYRQHYAEEVMRAVGMLTYRGTTGTFPEALAKAKASDQPLVHAAVERYEAATQTMMTHQSTIETYNDEFVRRGGWTRAFLVQNTNGHVHKTMDCSTCFAPGWNDRTGQWRDGTLFAWMVDYSGATEEQVVADAGQRACTVCYPTAPVDVLSRPTKMFGPDEVKAQEAREAREAARAAKEAKRVANALTEDGSPLVLRVDEEGRRTEKLQTVRSGKMWLTDSAHWVAIYAANGRTGRHPSYPADAEQQVAEAVAAKEGKTVEVVMAEATKRAAKRR